MRLALAAGLALILAPRASAGPSYPALDRAARAYERGDFEAAREALPAARERAWLPEHEVSVALLYAKLKDYDAAQSLLEEMIRASPRDPSLRVYLATVVARSGDRGAMMDALEQAGKLGPDAADRQRMAYLYQDLKEYAPARALLDRLVEEKPRDLSVRLDRAWLAAQTGETKTGVEQIEAARALGPGPADLRRMIAYSRDLGALELGRELLAELTRAGAAAAAPEIERAALDLKAGRTEDARAALGRARALSPSVDELIRVSLLYHESGAYEPARDALTEAIRLDPRRARARIELALLEARRGDSRAALAAAKDAELLEPDRQDRKVLAQAYDSLEDYKTALRMVDALLKEEPNDPQLLLDRASYSLDAGDERAARKFLRAARNARPDPDDSRLLDALEERLNKRAAAGK